MCFSPRYKLVLNTLIENRKIINCYIVKTGRISIILGLFFQRIFTATLDALFYIIFILFSRINYPV